MFKKGIFLIVLLALIFGSFSCGSGTGVSPIPVPQETTPTEPAITTPTPTPKPEGEKEYLELSAWELFGKGGGLSDLEQSILWKEYAGRGVRWIIELVDKLSMETYRDGLFNDWADEFSQDCAIATFKTGEREGIEGAFCANEVEALLQYEKGDFVTVQGEFVEYNRKAGALRIKNCSVVGKFEPLFEVVWSSDTRDIWPAIEGKFDEAMIAGETIYVAYMDKLWHGFQLYALNRQTGEVVWETRPPDRHKDYKLLGADTSLLYISRSWSGYCRIVAFSRKTGEIALDKEYKASLQEAMRDAQMDISFDPIEAKEAEIGDVLFTVTDAYGPSSLIATDIIKNRILWVKGYPAIWLLASKDNLLYIGVGGSIKACKLTD